MSNPGTRIYGIMSAQIVDNAGETVLLDGIDDRMKLLVDEHTNDDSFHNIGVVTKTRKIHNPDECEDVYQKKCWDYVKAPFLYGECELFDGEGHPNAVSAASIMRFISRPDVNPYIPYGFSLDGGIIQRTDANGNPTEDKTVGKTLASVLATRLAFTPKPCCPKARAWLFNDLQKSDYTMEPPKAYLEALQKSESAGSIIESISSVQLKLLMKTEKLKKSVDDFLRAFTSVKCLKCGTPHRFFKTNIPNKCEKCDSAYNVSQIWTALNK